MAIGQNNSNTAQGGIQGQTPATPAARPKQQGSGFTNLQRVIGANKNNQLGSAISTGMGNRVGQIKNDIGQAQNSFNTQLQGNRVDTEENKNLVNTALTNPYEAAKDDKTVSSFQNLMSGQYKGPTELGNANVLNAQAQEAAQYGQGATSAGGRTNLLQRFAGGNNYNAGQQRLDNVLLGQTGANDLKQVRRDAAGLGTTLNNASLTAQSQAQAAAAANKGFADDINTQLGGFDDPNTPDVNEAAGVWGDMYSGVNAKRDQYVNSQTDLNTRINNALRAGPGNVQLDADVAAALGVSDGQRTGALDYSNLSAHFDPQNVNLSNIAGQEDYTKASALRRLTGQSNDFLTDPTQAGTATGANFDSAQFKDLLAGSVGTLGQTEQQLAAARQSASADVNRIAPQMVNTLNYLKQQLAARPLTGGGQAQRQSELAALQAQIDRYTTDPNAALLEAGGIDRNRPGSTIAQWASNAGVPLYANQLRELAPDLGNYGSYVQNIYDQTQTANNTQSQLAQLMAQNRTFQIKK